MNNPDQVFNLKEAQKREEMRVTETANHGADVQKEVHMNSPAPKEKSIFGEV